MNVSADVLPFFSNDQRGLGVRFEDEFENEQLEFEGLLTDVLSIK